MPKPTDHTPDPADSDSQRERAYRRIRRMLLLQEIAAGTPLREAFWAERLMVSRTAVREAFARLEAEGLIDKGARAGYIVPTLTAQDVLDILEARVVMESGAMERLCRLGLNTPERLEPARRACSDLEDLVRAQALDGVPEVDRRFHEAIVAAAGSRCLVRLYLHAPIPVIHPSHLTRQAWLAQTASETLAEHRAVLSALLSGKATEAMRLLREHLLARYLKVYGADGAARSSPEGQTACCQAKAPGSDRPAGAGSRHVALRGASRACGTPVPGAPPPKRTTRPPK